MSYNKASNPLGNTQPRQNSRYEDGRRQCQYINWLYFSGKTGIYRILQS